MQDSQDKPNTAASYTSTPSDTEDASTGEQASVIDERTPAPETSDVDERVGRPDNRPGRPDNRPGRPDNRVGRPDNRPGRPDNR